jgi:hypothetical protein
MLSDALRPKHRHSGQDFSRAAHRCGWILGALSLLFALRVLGQAVQAWAPQAFLPPFGAFQGSALPYWILLPAQLLILGLMLWLSWRVETGTLRSNPRVGIILLWAGSIYLAAALGRLCIGLGLPDAPAWFRAWISGVWHVVLASFVLVLAGFHRRSPSHEERS